MVTSMGRTTRAGQEKETMADFIAKKREMFLVQMSLDTKREEIRKLEEKAQMKVRTERGAERGREGGRGGGEAEGQRRESGWLGGA